jgi:hypothetical protein
LPLLLPPPSPPELLLVLASVRSGPFVVDVTEHAIATPPIAPATTSFFQSDPIVVSSWCGTHPRYRMNKTAQGRQTGW